MLIQFNFKNYKSFKDDTSLDLTSTKITELSDQVIRIGNEKLLPAAAIYGANASGKSNVIDAFSFMAKYVIQSFAYGGDSDRVNSGAPRLRVTPFLFDSESSNAESSFEVFFIGTKEQSFKSYNYGFTINREGICEEWLNYKSKTAREYSPIFYRSKDELDLSGLPPKSHDNLKVSLQKETLIVSLGAKLKITKLAMIRNWFLNTTIANFGNPMENFFLSSVIPSGFADDEAVQANVVKYLSAFDPSIIKFNVEKIKSSDDDEHYKIDSIHKTIDGGTAAIPLKDESDGTLKMFALYPVLQDALDNGGVLLVDELNARLHPLLVRNILLTFLNPEINVNHAQIIFTTHDSWQLSNNILRRDEIWFTEKDSRGVSTLYSLADFVDEDGAKIRKDESYEKNYLLGKYGAIPTLKYFDMFKEVENGQS